MNGQTVIRRGISVDKRVEPAAEVSEGGHEWHVRLTVTSDHEFPVNVAVCDQFPANVGPANVALPPAESEGNWTLDTTTATCRTVVPPEDSVTVSYLLHTDAVDEATLVGATTIDDIEPIDPATGDSTTRGTASAVESSDSAHVRTDGAVTVGDVREERTETASDRGIESVSQFETSERAASESGFLVPRKSEADPIVSFVMPTMNEEAGIRECIERAKNALESLGLTGEIIVSDSSDDQTPDIAAELGAHVVTPDRKGYGYAYRYAFERARGEYVVIGDADTTYDFEELPKLFERLQETDADMVMGSRLEGEIKPEAMPTLHQYVGNPLLTKFLNVFYEAGVSDAHSGFRIIRRDALAELDLQSDGMEFASEMIMQAADRGLRIEEVPIVYHPREGEATLDSFRDGWRHVRFMLLNAPGYLFSGPAIGLGIVGAVMMLLSLMDRPFAGVYFGQHTMIAGCLVTIVGYQVGSLGLFSAVAAEPIRSPRDPVTEFILDRFRLEHGALLGLGLFTGGALYTTYLIVQWVQSGYTELPVIPVNMLAFMVLVLGIQTVFYSFFLSLLDGTESTDE
jgi:hypothetical protein